MDTAENPHEAKVVSDPDSVPWPHPIVKPEAEWTEFDRDYIDFMRTAYAEGFEAVPPCIRMHNLSWGHHQLVAPLGTDRQREWLEKASEQGWSISELRSELRTKRIAEEREANPWPTGKYRVVYADPPWLHDVVSR